MNLSDFTVPIVTINLPLADKYGISVAMARVDTVHPLASGNKLYKLLPNIDYALQNNYQQILSFGGAFSNHIHALALYAQSVGLQSIAIIRGEKEYANNSTLSTATAAGMRLVFVDRATYKRRYDKDYLQQLQQQYPEALIIPEGGSSELALQGCTELMRQINKSCLQRDDSIPDTVAVACGTGMTFSGLMNGAQPDQTVQGYLVVKDHSVAKRVDDLLANHSQHQPYKMHYADLGGYAKFKAPLLEFILEFLQQTNILLDPIYTSKMCYCIMQQIEAGQFKVGSKLVIVHSGGLQAWYGMKRKVVMLAGDYAWQKIEGYL
ncbi:MAG: pyridoxal-phosphate dependent enzyme [Cocleimonas sp.]|nr:pyridoxal-phosphate dependent enzyme [Cocleimonas sp.]